MSDCRSKAGRDGCLLLDAIHDTQGWVGSRFLSLSKLSYAVVDVPLFLPDKCYPTEIICEPRA